MVYYTLKACKGPSTDEENISGINLQKVTTGILATRFLTNNENEERKEEKN
jgi:hypothetical protein